MNVETKSMETRAQPTIEVQKGEKVDPSGGKFLRFRVIILPDEIRQLSGIYLDYSFEFWNNNSTKSTELWVMKVVIYF